MSGSLVRTRFAPSPTGALHMGNARTALFNWLFARRHGGAFILRSEDTDRARGSEAALAGVHADLDWLGLARDEGPDVGGPLGPYRQSERHERHRRLLDRLLALELAYPCFCTREELAAARHRQVAAGRPPRYPGTCRDLDETERGRRRAQGRSATLRFRVPASGEIEFDDCVHGAQRVRLDDIGDFVIARGDGSPAFFLANAVDDADMGISHVLRGADHLANTPRQLLLLRALELDEPVYGHFGLITGSGDAPMSKRTGATALAELRAAGFRPEAVINHLARIGCSGLAHELLELPALAAGFDPGAVSRGPAGHDAEALDGWQRRALDAQTTGALVRWLDEQVPDVLARAMGPAERERFVEAVRPNVLLPADARAWARVAWDTEIAVDEDAQGVIVQAGAELFERAARIAEPDPGDDFTGWTRAVAQQAGVRGARLYRPLRAALTGCLAGPELARLAPLIGAERIRRRLDAAARLAARD